MAGLLFFVGREMLRTSRETASREPPPAEVTEDTAPTAEVAPAGQAVTLPTPPRPAMPAGPAKLDHAELRRRVQMGAAGTYIGDMLADRDSTLSRWSDRMIDPVRVWIQRSSTMPDWNPDHARVVRTAFDEWSEVGCPVRFSFVVDSTRAEIRVNFTDRMTDGTRLGLTLHQQDRDGYIVGAEIRIATHDTAGKALAPVLIEAIARHEVGHALGLAHSKDRSTIMFAESQTLVITQADRATLKLLYSLPPGSVRGP